MKLKIARIKYADPHNGVNYELWSECGALCCVLWKQVWKMPHPVQLLFADVAYGATGDILGAVEVLSKREGEVLSIERIQVKHGTQICRKSVLQSVLYNAEKALEKLTQCGYVSDVEKRKHHLHIGVIKKEIDQVVQNVSVSDEWYVSKGLPAWKKI